MADVFRLAVESKMRAIDTYINVFTFEADDLDLVDIGDAPDYFDDFWHSGLLALLADVWTTTRIILEKPDGAGHWSYVDEVPYVRAGGNSNSALPNQVAAVLVGITPSRRRGKKFIGAWTEQDTGNGTFSNTALTALNTTALVYIAQPNLGTADVEPGVCKPDGTAFLAFSNYRVDLLMGTQRRRKPGVGV